VLKLNEFEIINPYSVDAYSDHYKGDILWYKTMDHSTNYAPYNCHQNISNYFDSLLPPPLILLLFHYLSFYHWNYHFVLLLIPHHNLRLSHNFLFFINLIFIICHLANFESKNCLSLVSFINLFEIELKAIISKDYSS